MSSKGRSETKETPRDQKDLSDWLKSLYALKEVDDAFIKQLDEAFSYKGFNRDEVIAQLKVQVSDPNLSLQLIVVTALRGPKAAGGIKLLNGKTPNEMGIPSSGGKNQKRLTLSKILAATSDIAAFFLKRLNVPKRIHSSPLPGWLQFPSAGSIQLPTRYREQHKEFAVQFSSLIGGEFNEGIYEQMSANAYLDNGLKLFDN